MLNKDELQKIINDNPFSEYIGMELVESSLGKAYGRVRFEVKHKNFYGGMHGGCSFALADTIAGVAALTYGNYVTTVSSSMNYLREIKDTEYVNCYAEVVRHGKRISVFDVKLTDDAGELLMTGTMTYYAVGEIGVLP
ncbi:MAG: PaaI family thioesterase [Lachnospiraceae bacterium]|nr:PaaI family thioesterase [Lachnospiraceae bacterium]